MESRWRTPTLSMSVVVRGAVALVCWGGWRVVVLCCVASCSNLAFRYPLVTNDLYSSHTLTPSLRKNNRTCPRRLACLGGYSRPHALLSTHGRNGPAITYLAAFCSFLSRQTKLQREKKCHLASIFCWLVLLVYASAQ